MQLQLNFKVKEQKTDKVEKVRAKKTKKILTMDEAWAKISSMKNSEADKAKLKEVYIAMAKGEIGREVGSENKSFSKAEALRLHKQLMELQREQKLEEMVANTPDNYILATDVLTIGHMLEVLSNEPIIAVDTETTGVNVYKDKIVGVSFTAPVADLHWYIPLRHEEANAPFAKAKYYIERILKLTNDKVFHNALFDLHMFMGEGLTVSGLIHDTMNIMHILNENEPSYRLKDLATKYLNMPSDTFDVLFGKNCVFSTVALKYARYYACKDTHITWKLFDFQRRHLANQPKLLKYYQEVELPLLKVVFRMEREGFLLDMQEVEKQKAELTKGIADLEVKLSKWFGDINFKSPAQLSKVLYDDLKLARFLPEGVQKGTGTDVLKHLVDHCEGVALLLKYKDWVKQLTGFVEKLPEMIQPDGKIHGSFKQSGTVTGRFASVNPNLQQQPKVARKMFRVEDDCVIIGADFSAQELRMLAHLTQDPFLLDIYRTGKDFYSQIASKVFNLPIEQCGNDTEPRKKAKVVVLGLLYGMATPTLAKNLGIEKEEAEQIVEDFFSNFTAVKAWMDKNVEFCKKHGYVEMLFGRKRRLPDMQLKTTRDNFWIIARAERQAKANAVIQGSSAVQTKMVMIKLDEYCLLKQQQGRKFGLLATIHDEVLIKAPKDVTQEELSELNKIMTETLPLSVPSKSDFEIGNCWGRMEKIAVA